MARSVSALAGIIVMFGATTLAACDSTSTQNARVKLSTTREIAARQPQTVTTHNPDLTVTATALVHDHRGSAIVVELKNTASRPQTDVPIQVGVRTGGQRVVLNDAADLSWFQTHVASVPASGTTTWVFLPPKRAHVKANAQPFARVGVNAGPVTSSATELPALVVRPAPGSTPTQARVLIQNPSGIPQSSLQVSATAREGDAYTAAGVTTLPYVGKNRQAIVAVPLVGKAKTPIRVIATPTIFQ